MLEGCIAEVHNITSLDISDNGEPGVGAGRGPRLQPRRGGPLGKMLSCTSSARTCKFNRGVCL